MRRFALLAACCALATATLSSSSLSSHVLAQVASAQASVETSASTTRAPEAAAAAAPAAQPGRSEEQLDERDRAWDLRAGTSYYGPAGGIYVVDAASGAPQSFRLQAITDFFVIKDYLYNDDKDRYVGSSFALSVTPIKYLELNAAVTNSSNRNTRTDPTVLQSVGSMYFGIKSWGEPTRGLAIGGDATVSFRNGPGDVGIDAGGTSISLRGNLSLDLRKMTTREVPLILRANFGYFFDNSAKMVEATERKRLANLQAQGLSAGDAYQEYRHLARRDERLAFNVNRLDYFQIALGLEVPIEAHERFAIHPLAEWQLDVPVNRQGFDCLFVQGPNGGKLGGTDSCLADEGVDTFHQRLVAGVRMYPGLPGLNFLLGAELGVGGTTNFVQELAPAAPYRILLAAGYTADVKKKKPEVVIKEVEKLVEVPVGETLGRIRGSVIEQGDVGIVVANARVSFPGRDASRLLSGADGTFTSYAFAPGPVQLEIEADGYEPGNCSTNIPADGGDVSLACMIVALPRNGTANLQLLDEKGTPLPGVVVAITGAESKSAVSDAEGKLRLSELKPGEYRARVEQAGYLISVTTFVVKVREETSLTIQLVPAPKHAAVRVRGNKLQVRGTIFFAPNTAQIEARSTALLVEIANVLMQHPELLQVEVQGHTDDTGSPARNTQLGEERAEAVADWLIAAGVERDRLLAKGYGADKPLAPNLTEQNRARNRRVEFVILQRAGE